MNFPLIKIYCRFYVKIKNNGKNRSYRNISTFYFMSQHSSLMSLVISNSSYKHKLNMK